MPDNGSRKQQLLHLLGEIILFRLPNSGLYEMPVPGLTLARVDHDHTGNHCLSQPMVMLAIQGKKKIDACGREIYCNAGECLVTCVDTPHASTVLDAHPERPFLALNFLLDKKILSDLAGEMPFVPGAEARNLSSINVQKADTPFLDTLLRLTETCATPQHLPILAPLFLRELHYYLLTGPEGQMLRELYLKGSLDNRIIEAINWLKSHVTSAISIDTLARKVNMSVSSLHRHFKNVTGYTPLQYHKQLRLYEAQRLMLTENERADMAGMAVGYESITQFNREYKRMFGLPPHKDIQKRKSSS